MPRIAGERLPATYINHYTANGAVFLLCITRIGSFRLDCGRLLFAGRHQISGWTSIMIYAAFRQAALHCLLQAGCMCVCTAQQGM